MIANLISAGAFAVLPLIMEAMREKPDPEAAKEMLLSHRQERIDRNIGAGMSMQQAEKQVDSQLEQEFQQAEKEGSFNTPWGEMVAGAVLGVGLPWAAGLAKGAASAGKFGKTIQGFAGGAKADVAAGAAATPKTNPSTIAPPAAAPVKPSMPDLVTAEELAPVQMRAEAMSRMQPSAMDIRNTRMLNNVPAPQQKPLTQADIDKMLNEIGARPTASVPAAAPASRGPFPLSGEEAAAAEAIKKQQYYDKLRTLDDGTTASRVPQGPFPESQPSMRVSGPRVVRPDPVRPTVYQAEQLKRVGVDAEGMTGAEANAALLKAGIRADPDLSIDEVQKILTGSGMKMNNPIRPEYQDSYRQAVDIHYRNSSTAPGQARPLPISQDDQFRKAIDAARTDADLTINPTVTGEIRGTMPTRTRIRDTSAEDALQQQAQERAMFELRRRQLDAMMQGGPFPPSLARPRTVGTPILSYSGI